MERFAAEGIKAQRDQNVKAALKAKMPLFEVMAEFGLTEAEVGQIIKDQGAGPQRRDDIRDARDEKGGAARGR